MENRKIIVDAFSFVFRCFVAMVNLESPTFSQNCPGALVTFNCTILFPLRGRPLIWRISDLQSSTLEVVFPRKDNATNTSVIYGGNITFSLSNNYRAAEYIRSEATFYVAHGSNFNGGNLRCLSGNIFASTILSIHIPGNYCLHRKKAC